MATVDGRSRTLAKLETWLALISPVIAGSPAAQEVFVPVYGGFAQFVSNLRGFILSTPFSDTELAGAFFTRTLGRTNLVNRAAGSTITWNPTLGTYQAIPLPVVAPVAPFTGFPEPTPTQVAAFGPAVDLSSVAPALVEAAALLDPESLAAQFINAQGEPTAPFPPTDAFDVAQVRQESEIPVTDSSPAVRELQLIRKTDMPNGIFDPLGFNPFGISGSFFPDDPPIVGAPPIEPPVSPGFGGFDIGDALKELLEGIVKGEGVGDILSDVFAGGFGIPITDTGDTLPVPEPTAIAPGQPPLPGVAPDLQRALLELLKSFPPTAVPATAADLIFGGLGRAQPTAPLVGGLPVTVGMNGLAGVPCDVKTVMNTQIKQVHTAPKGFVVVVCTGSNGLPVKMAMWKPLAIKLGLWRAARKPPMSASEWRCLKTADRVKNKVKRIAGTAGFKTEVKGRARRRPSKVC